MSTAARQHDDARRAARVAVVGTAADTAADTVEQESSFSEVFSQALAGEPCTVTGLGRAPRPLPVTDWLREADAADRALVSACAGPVLDIGCGPGRLTAHLTWSGHLALGIDIVPEAVRQARRRGASALVRDVFDDLPGQGGWRTALLADGNIGIGGDPQALLRRVRELLAPRGRVVVEVEPPGVESESGWASLECGGRRSRPFRWAVVGADAVDVLARSAGLGVEHVDHHVDHHGERWWSVLTASP